MNDASLHRMLSEDWKVGDYVYVTNKDGVPVDGGHAYSKARFELHYISSLKLGIDFKKAVPYAMDTSTNDLSVFRINKISLHELICTIFTYQEYLNEIRNR